ncbi:MAG: PcfJ domain-containing protein [Oscillospiraceae bacterium]|nr:PcfJ domain-containing protein [Oscillospiraceae bacterium]
MDDRKKCEQLASAAPPLTKDNLNALNALFPSFIFRRRRTGEVWCTCCGTHGTLPADSKVMQADHSREPERERYFCHMGAWAASAPKPLPEPVACPYCGKVSPVKELGRTGRRENLRTYRRAVVFRWYRNALWAVAYDVGKGYEDETRLTDGPTRSIAAIYRFRPGQVDCANTFAWWYREWHYFRSIKTDGLRPKFKISEPFSCSAEYGTGYDVVGIDEVYKSQFRWCDINAYRKEGSKLMRYLTVCTAYPRQVEMLTKAGMVDAVVDFAERGVSNARAFDWACSDPWKGLGLNKTELKEFQNGGHILDVLAQYKSLRKGGTLASLTELYSLRQALGPDWFRRVCTRMRRYHLSYTKICNYLDKVHKAEKGRKKKGPGLPTVAGWWCDYIDAAEVLGLDLKNTVFLLPKDLRGHHDEATKTADVLKEARRKDGNKEKERKRFKNLAARYTYTDGRWLIRPPAGAAEIVAEGKALKHCVGGYADRHINGQTTILFLRDRQRPGRPLVTIEIRGSNIIQIHGWDDERTACKDNPQRLSPREIYKDFLDGFVGWVEGGSKRNRKGYPVLPKAKKREVA